MSSVRVTRHLALIAGGAAIAGTAMLSACSSTKSPEAPSTPPPSQSESVTPSPSGSTPAPIPSPTEKAAGSGPNSFTPTIKANPPGAVCVEVRGNNCLR